MLISENVDGSRNSKDVSDPYVTVDKSFVKNVQESFVVLHVLIAWHISHHVPMVFGQNKLYHFFDVYRNSKDVSDPYVTVDTCADGKHSYLCVK